MRNHVIYLGVCSLPDKNAQANRAMAICRLFKDKGKEIIVIGDTKEALTSNDVLETRFAYGSVSCFLMPYPKSRKEWLARVTDASSVIEIIEYYGVNNIDILILGEYYSVVCIKLMRYCEKNNVKVIFDTVDWFSMRLTFSVDSLIKNLDTFIRMRVLHKKAKYMITISSYLFDYYSKHVERAVLIPSIVDVDDSKFLRIQNYVGNDILTLAYIGHSKFNLKKERIDWAIRAVCKLAGEGAAIKLFIAGISRDDVENDAPELTDLMGFSDCIELFGVLGHEESLRLVSMSDFSVIPRENTRLNKAGLPTKLGESICCGTPILATPFGDMGRYIVNGENGFLASDCTYHSFYELLQNVVCMKFSREELISLHRKTKECLSFIYSTYQNEIELLLD